MELASSQQAGAKMMLSLHFASRPMLETGSLAGFEEVSCVLCKTDGFDNLCFSCRYLCAVLVSRLVGWGAWERNEHRG